MIQRDDILSMEYLKKTEFTGCHKGMRYRLEKAEEDGERRLKCTVWPEPFNFFTTPDEQKESELFDFEESGVEAAVAWMNTRFSEEREKWEHAASHWDVYRLR
ncbi:MAG: hypothetical protein NC417_07545 [Candidatus Gastranaerophilales bacterium]|nr:hypothetical protein [Candidatus Gastranaerophilales bacterium]